MVDNLDHKVKRLLDEMQDRHEFDERKELLQHIEQKDADQAYL